MTATRASHVRALDGLRGLAVLLVMAYHCQLLSVQARPYQLLRGGWAGVDIFFVLSGYLITSGLVAGASAGTTSLRPFYARRARRLAPAALALLAAWTVVSLTGLVPVAWAGHAPGTSRVVLSLAPVVGLLSLGYNWWLALGAPNPYGMGQLWSLTIEEQFYFAWPALVYRAFRQPERAIRRLLIGCGVAGLAALTFTIWATTSGHRDLAYFGTPTRMFGLIVGAALALLQASGAVRASRPGLRQVRRLGAVASVVIIALIAVRAPDTAAYLVPAISLTVAIVVWAAITDAEVGDTWFRWRWLRWCGRRSYALYLWHSPCLLASQHLLGVGWLSSGASVTAALACGAVSWRLIERRFLVARRAAPTPPTPLAAVPVAANRRPPVQEIVV